MKPPLPASPASPPPEHLLCCGECAVCPLLLSLLCSMPASCPSTQVEGTACWIAKISWWAEYKKILGSLERVLLP